MELILEGEFVLERFPGKGGWTFIRIPKTLLPSGKAFGMIKLSGKIDEFEFEGKHLMPMGQGVHFLTVAKPIRTAIGKEEGEMVWLKLFRDEIPNSIPEELIDCLKDDPGKLPLFYQLSESVQKHWVEFIYSADSEDRKAARIVKLLNELRTGA